MAQKNDLRVAAEEIERALRALVHDRASARVYVFETEWGNLRALLGDGSFSGMSPGRRQEVVWDYLREHVSEESLKHLYGVHPMDLDEYDVRVVEVKSESSFPP